MRRSFDDIFKSRIGNQEAKPPVGAKEQIFAQIGVPAPTYTVEDGYSVVAALLILLSFFQIGGVKSGVEPKHTSSEKSLAIASVTLPYQEENESEVLSGQVFEEVIASSQTDQAKTYESALMNLNEENHQKFSYAANPHRFELNFLKVSKHAPRSHVLLNRKYRPKRIIPEKEKTLYPYYNVGAFFMYNRVRPNLTDDIYVGEYDAPFGMSPSRIGLVLEGGIHKKWNALIATRLGVSINNFNQSYSFTVRSAKPDSVSVDEESGYLEPHFDKEHVRVSKRVTVIGLKGQMFWYIFPNQANVLFTSFEYQHLIGSGPKFSFQNENYKLMKPSQYMLEFGLRKLILERRSAEMYLMPGIRYSLAKYKNEELITVTPFSVGVTLSYQLK
ncbi:MAG: hypothetical protein ABJN36_20440 [Cyclobacteriaceae bacterium]